MTIEAKSKKGTSLNVFLEHSPALIPTWFHNQITVYVDKGCFEK
jgi:hypothetical protein